MDVPGLEQLARDTPAEQDRPPAGRKLLPGDHPAQADRAVEEYHHALGEVPVDQGTTRVLVRLDQGGLVTRSCGHAPRLGAGTLGTVEISLHALAAMARAGDERLAGELLVWRGRLQGAVNLPDESFTFIVPMAGLIGADWLSGSPVVHEYVDRPMVALRLPV